LVVVAVAVVLVATVTPVVAVVAVNMFAGFLMLQHLMF
jgi:hypothetical protein